MIKRKQIKQGNAHQSQEVFKVFLPSVQLSSPSPYSAIISIKTKSGNRPDQKRSEWPWGHFYSDKNLLVTGSTNFTANLFRLTMFS